MYTKEFWAYVMSWFVMFKMNVATIEEEPIVFGDPLKQSSTFGVKLDLVKQVIYYCLVKEMRPSQS